MAFWVGRIGGGIFVGLALFAMMMLGGFLDNLIIATAISLLAMAVFIAVGGSVIEWIRELDWWT